MRGFMLAAVSLLAAGTATAGTHALHIDSWPPRSRVEVTGPGGEVRRGRAPLRLRLPEGKVTVRATRPGHRDWSETFELQRRTAVTACLDPEDQLVRCQRIIPCATRPKSVVLSPDGSEVWVAILWGPITLQVFDTGSGKKLEQLSLTRHGGTELELSADQSKVYLSQMATAEVHELDRKTRKVLRTFDTRGTWTKVIKLSADESTLFASNWVSSDVSIIDLKSGKLRRRVRTVGKPRGMYPTRDGRYLYVAGFKDGELQKIDLKTGRKKTLYSKGVSLRHIVADEERGKLFISDLARNQILTLDLESDKIRHFTRTNNKPNTIALSPDRRILYVSNRGRQGPVKYTEPGPEWGSVLLLDAHSGKILDAIVGGNQPTALAVSRDGKTLVFSDFLDNRLRVYRVPSYDKLRAGEGGRARSHRAELKKRDWRPPQKDDEGAKDGKE